MPEWWGVRVDAAASSFALLRFNTRDVAERDRVTYWHDFFASRVMNCTISPLTNLPFEVDATLLALPGLRVMWACIQTPITMTRTPEMATDGDDSFAMLIKRRGRMDISQRGVDLSLGDGEAVGLLHSEPARITPSHADYVGLIVPDAVMGRYPRQVSQSAMRIISSDNEALRVLGKFAGLLQEEAPLTTPELRYSAVTHIYELMALALGSTRDPATTVVRCHVRAARLAAVKADILEHLDNPELAVAQVALRQRVTPRYVHMLFEAEGITFSEFVLAHRLERSRRMLWDPRFARSSITAIAFEAGFSDLSHFGRAFRHRFGATPSDVRKTG